MTATATEAEVATQGGESDGTGGAGEPGTEVAGVGRNDLGSISVGDGVVAKIAGQAAREVPDAGAAAPRMLGRSLESLPGVRRTNLQDAPKVTAQVDGSVVHLSLQMSVRWPRSVAEVSAAVRRHVTERVGEMTGLDVTDIHIEVTDLVTHIDPPPRVR